MAACCEETQTQSTLSAAACCFEMSEGVQADFDDVLTVFIAEAIVQELAYDEFNA